MNYEFDLEEWLPKFPLRIVRQTILAKTSQVRATFAIMNICVGNCGTNLIGERPFLSMCLFIQLVSQKTDSRPKSGACPIGRLTPRWPKTEMRSFNGHDSTIQLYEFNEDIVGELPQVTCCYIFGDSSEDCGFGPFYFEWQNIGLSNLVTELPTDQMVVPASYGNRCG